MHDCSRCEGYRVSKVIQVEITQVYGNKTVYPACDTARTFAKMMGTKTLTPHMLGCIKQLGYEILVVPTKL